jgi:hypothetical protein
MIHPPTDTTDNRDQATCGKRPSCSPDDTAGTQLFPTKGYLFDNLDLTKSDLERRIGHLTGQVRFYTLNSIKEDGAGLLQQTGSGPNFQGGELTLCTCVPHIRAEPRWANAAEWWIAGFTDTKLKSLRHRSGSLIHYLFYLAKVQVAYTSPAELWHALDDRARRKKSTRLHPLGDVFEPNPSSPCKDHHKADHYFPPMLGHDHRMSDLQAIWKDYDIEQCPHRRHPRLLRADPSLTFIWQTPLIYKDYRRHGTWDSVCKCLSELTPV